MSRRTLTTHLLAFASESRHACSGYRSTLGSVCQLQVTSAPSCRHSLFSNCSAFDVRRINMGERKEDGFTTQPRATKIQHGDHKTKEGQQDENKITKQDGSSYFTCCCDSCVPRRSYFALPALFFSQCVSRACRRLAHCRSQLAADVEQIERKKNISRLRDIKVT